jgi:glutamine cyclotransferase
MDKSTQKTVAFALLSILSFWYGCADNPMTLQNDEADSAFVTDEIPNYTYQVVNTYPHHSTAFTQGLVFDDGFFLEGTGLSGRSSLRRVELPTGLVTKLRELDARFFGEGITVYEDLIIQLTWTSRQGFVYQKSTFEPVGEFAYPTQGWGITHDGTRLIMSDGTDKLFFLSPNTFERVGEISVFDESGPVTLLNELEFIDGRVFANVWTTDKIVVINPETGEVTSSIDLTGLLASRATPAAVLNGIAFDSENQRLFVTGKLWPAVFEIKLVPQT